MRPPIEKYGVLQWGAAQEIEQVGYDQMKKEIEGWQQEQVARRVPPA